MVWWDILSRAKSTKTAFFYRQEVTMSTTCTTITPTMAMITEWVSIGLQTSPEIILTRP